MKNSLVILKLSVCFFVFLNPLFLIYAESSFENTPCSKQFSCKKKCKKNKKNCERCCRGPRGHQGKKGDHGDRGHRGKKGKAGDLGHRGKRGDIGEQGIRGDVGPDGPQGRPGRSGADCACFHVFGTWFVPGNTLVTVPLNTKVPFVNTEASNGITNDVGTFTFPNTGVYRCDIGIVSNAAAGNNQFYDLILNPQTTPIILNGGEIIGSSTRGIGINPISLLFSANAGDTVELRYAGSRPGVSSSAIVGQSAVLGPNFAKLNFAFISFLQVQ